MRYARLGNRRGTNSTPSWASGARNGWSSCPQRSRLRHGRCALSGAARWRDSEPRFRGHRRGPAPRCARWTAGGCQLPVTACYARCGFRLAVFPGRPSPQSAGLGPRAALTGLNLWAMTSPAGADHTVAHLPHIEARSRNTPAFRPAAAVLAVPRAGEPWTGPLVLAPSRCTIRQEPCPVVARGLLPRAQRSLLLEGSAE